MLKQLEGHITQEQIDFIVNRIVKQYSEYDKLINNCAFKKLFSAEYAPHNKQYSVSWAISSGFPSGNFIYDGLKVDCFKYSNNFTRPLLHNQSIKILILNKTTHFDATYLNDFYNLNECSTNDTLFCYFKFSVDHGKLNKITLCYPDKHGKVISEELLLNKSQIQFKIAA